MGWYNSDWGLGSDDHAVVGTTFRRRVMFDRILLENLFRQSGVARKIVARMPFDATREGWDRYPDLDEELSRSLAGEERRLRLGRHVTDALIYERKYGGGAVILQFDDGRDSWEPLDLSRLRCILWSRSAHRWELWPHTYVQSGPDEGLSEVYQYLPDSGGDTQYVHRSRMLLFLGDAGFSDQERIECWGWGDPVLETVWTELRNAGIGDAGVIEYLLQLSVPILKVKKWWEILSGKNGRTRAEAVLTDFRKRLSMFRLGVLDADDDAVRLNATVAGLADILEHQKGMVSAVTDYPQTLLYGRSPAGENATGQSDLELYYGIVRARVQEDRLREALERWYQVVSIASIWGEDGETAENPLPREHRGGDPTIEFPPLWVPSEKERAETEAQRAMARGTYAGLGWIDPDEGRKILERDGLLEPEVCPEPGEVGDERRDARGDGDLLVPWRGRVVRVEIRAGERREFPGTPYPPTTMPCDYGEVVGTKGLDGDPTDVLIVPGGDIDVVHAGVVLHPEDGSLDELKLVLGATDEYAAQALLILCYGSQHVGACVLVEDDDLDVFLNPSGRSDAELSDEDRQPSKVVEDARRALEERAKLPPSRRSMTAVGLARARDIAN